MSEAGGAVRAAGRGGVAVLGAKAFFIVIGLAQQTLLPRVLGLAGYGALSRVMAVASIVNNVIVSTSIQGVSRAVAGARGHERDALGRAMRVHAPVAVGVAALFAAAAPALAAFQGAPHIRAPMAVTAVVTLAYGLYAPLVGALNGRARFGRQAALDVTSATLRTAGLVGLGALFVARGADGPLGAALGAALAALAILAIATQAARLPDAAGVDAARVAAPTASGGPLGYARKLASLAAAQLFTNALMQMDLWLLGRYLSQAAPNAVAADEWVAVYRACQLFAFLPFQLVMSVSQVLFPMVARAHAEGDRESVALWVSRGMRIAVLAAGLLVGVVVALPGPVLGLAFGPAIADRGAATLRVLALGQGAFTLFGVLGAVLASLGRERAAAVISFAAIALVTAGCAAAVPSAGFGEPQLRACAAVTTGALGLAFVAAAVLVRREAGALVPGPTALRAALAFGAVVVLGGWMPASGKLGAVAAAVACGLAYGAALLVTGELGRDDVATLRNILARRR